MNNLINNLKANITEENKDLVEELINIITYQTINSEKELMELEDKHFIIKGKTMSKSEKIEHCTKIILNSVYDADSMDKNITNYAIN